MSEALMIRDLTTLHHVATNIDDLKTRLTQAQQTMGIRQRGYLLPTEDEEVSRLFLAYRNHRLALYDILDRHRENGEAASRDDASFVLAFGAAMMLVTWSGIIVSTYWDIPPVRKKLNEPEPRFGIEEGLFDHIYERLTDPRNLSALAQAISVYEANRQTFTALSGESWSWLLDHLDQLVSHWEPGQWSSWRERLQREVHLWRKRATSPIKDAHYRLTIAVMDFFGNVWLGAIPRIPGSHRHSFRELMEPGDFFIVRPERKSSTVFLPGWWTHCTLFHGGPDQLKAAGAWDLPHIKKAHASLEKGINQRPFETIEALAAGIVLNPLSGSLHVDQAVAIRPLLSTAEKLRVLDDAFSHYGKAYDFEFDFTRSDRLVCTELIYRSLHGKGKLAFTLKPRYGRPTLSADDIAAYIAANLDGQQPLFEIVAISRKDTQSGASTFYAGTAAKAEFLTTVPEPG